jgi:RNase P/RNase MRP subunit p30
MTSYFAIMLHKRRALILSSRPYKFVEIRTIGTVVSVAEA